MASPLTATPHDSSLPRAFPSSHRVVHFRSLSRSFVRVFSSTGRNQPFFFPPQGNIFPTSSASMHPARLQQTWKMAFADHPSLFFPFLAGQLVFGQRESQSMSPLPPCFRSHTITGPTLKKYFKRCFEQVPRTPSPLNRSQLPFFFAAQQLDALLLFRPELFPDSPPPHGRATTAPDSNSHTS